MYKIKTQRRNGKILNVASAMRSWKYIHHGLPELEGSAKNGLVWSKRDLRIF